MSVSIKSLDRDTVQKIRDLLASGEKPKDVYKRLGIESQLVYRIHTAMTRDLEKQLYNPPQDLFNVDEYDNWLVNNP